MLNIDKKCIYVPPAGINCFLNYLEKLNFSSEINVCVLRDRQHIDLAHIDNDNKFRERLNKLLEEHNNKAAYAIFHLTRNSNNIILNNSIIESKGIKLYTDEILNLVFNEFSNMDNTPKWAIY